MLAPRTAAAFALLAALGFGGAAGAPPTSAPPPAPESSPPPGQRTAPTRGKIVVRPEFEANWDSLRRHSLPAWFRDAKLGFWSHWGPESVPMQGDWYARWLYGPFAGSEEWEREPARARRAFHERRYGHPSRFGFKDICNLWRAERFDPEDLVGLYRRAGGRYFVAMAAGPDNFDLWDSERQAWNSVGVGPRKDIVALWAKAARAADLPFGVSLHSARAWRFMSAAFGADPSGPLASVPYDGRASREQGQGSFWAGLDPRDLYGRPHGPDEPADAAFVERFYARARDLVEKYRPDLVAFDDDRLPFEKGSLARCEPPSDAGLRFVTDYYNANARWHGGADEALVAVRSVPDAERQALALERDRELPETIEAWPWQAVTALAEWTYREGARSKTARELVLMLADVVSKNGNLLVSVPQRPDGSIDLGARQVLRELTAWMDTNARAIHGTRPWTVFGEGAASVGDGRALTPQDLRFTVKGNDLYAIALAWPPDGRLLVRSLAKGAGLARGPVRGVELLGHAGRIRWQQTKAGLAVTLPPQKPCDHAWVLRVSLPG